MSKHRRLLRFGYSLRPTAGDLKRSLQLATLAEGLGLDYVGIQDLPNNAPDHDMWTLFTAIGVATSRISLFTNVADLQSRPPTLLAKAVASLDSLTGSRRVEVGLRAGVLTDPVAQMGGKKPSGKEALDALEEAIRAMRQMWGGEQFGQRRRQVKRAISFLISSQHRHLVSRHRARDFGACSAPCRWLYTCLSSGHATRAS